MADTSESNQPIIKGSITNDYLHPVTTYFSRHIHARRWHKLHICVNSPLVRQHRALRRVNRKEVADVRGSVRIHPSLSTYGASDESEDAHVTRSDARTGQLLTARTNLHTGHARRIALCPSDKSFLTGCVALEVRLVEKSFGASMKRTSRMIELRFEIFYL